MNNDNNQYDDLLKQAGGRIGMDPQSIAKNASNGKLENLISRMKPDEASRFKEALANPKLAEQILKSPQAQMLMKKFMK